jgi:hypothetical protein
MTRKSATGLRRAKVRIAPGRRVAPRDGLAVEGLAEDELLVDELVGSLMFEYLGVG